MPESTAAEKRPFTSFAELAQAVKSSVPNLLAIQLARYLKVETSVAEKHLALMRSNPLGDPVAIASFQDALKDMDAALARVVAERKKLDVRGI